MSYRVQSFRRAARSVVPALFIAAAAFAATACTTAAAGTAVPATVVPVVSTPVSAPVVSTPASVPVSPVTVSPSEPVTPSDEPATPTSEEPTEPTQEPTEPSDSPATPTEQPTEEPTEPTEEPTGTAHPSTFDQVTGVWLQTMCTDIYGFLGGLSAVPSVALSDGAVEYKQAWLDYFGQNAYNLEVMVGNISVLDAPTLPNGDEVHGRYIAYFDQLKQAAIEGWELIDAAGTDEQEIGAAVDAAVQKVESMSSDDMGMGDLIGPEYKAAMEQIDACAPLING